MKCPKCGYLGFDTSPRCRNCSYDFALLEAGEDGALPLDLDPGSSMAPPTAEKSTEASWLLAIDHGIAAAAATGLEAHAVEASAIEAAVAETRMHAARSGLNDRDVVRMARPVFDASDLDRLLSRAESVPVSGPVGSVALVVDVPSAPDVRHQEASAASLPGADPFAWPESPAGRILDGALVTHDAGVQGCAGLDDVDVAPARIPVRRPPHRPTLDEDTPLVQLQRPRAPIAVRKTPMSPKLRAVAQPKPIEPELDFVDEPLPADGLDPAALHAWTALSPGHDSPAGRRLGALFVDALLFSGIDAAVLYLTLRVAGLQVHELAVLPAWPLVLFLGLMKVAYVAVFTAMGGQTIGKMAMQIRVVSADYRTLSGGAALRRTLASLLSVVTAGLGYLPGLVGRDRRAVHDRIAGSRVVTAGAA